MATLRHSIAGEQSLLTSDNGVLMLTNYRVKYEAKVNGMSKFVSISLDSVSSCGLVTRSFPILLVIAGILAIVAIAGFAKSGLAAGVLLLLAALVFGVAYPLTRTGGITVSSNGGEEIFVPSKGMSHESTLVFLEAVMEAKLKFIGKI